MMMITMRMMMMIYQWWWWRWQWWWWQCQGLQTNASGDQEDWWQSLLCGWRETKTKGYHKHFVDDDDNVVIMLMMVMMRRWRQEGTTPWWQRNITISKNQLGLMSPSMRIDLRKSLFKDAPRKLRSSRGRRLVALEPGFWKLFQSCQIHSHHWQYLWPKIICFQSPTLSSCYKII